MVAPNPMVGCVIVKNDESIAEGYHQKYGGPHAEVNAINSLPIDFDFTDCTLYVNLEPCSHHGKTPPCSDLIISKKFKRVVVGNLDTNPLVAGKGIQKLKDAGIGVSSGVINSEARELNKRFFWYHEKKQPYVILKWGITCTESKELVHKWRAEEQSILVGTNTVVVDDPELTARLVEGNNPVRIVIDRELKLPTFSKVFSSEGKVLVVTEKDKLNTSNITYCKINFDRDFVNTLLNTLFELSIQSVIIEGGSKLLNSFIETGVWNEARIFVGTKEFINGIKAPVFNKANAEELAIGADKLYIIKK